MRGLIITVCLAIHALSALPQGNNLDHLFTTPLNYTIYKTSTAIHIDGKAADKDWIKAPWSSYFVDIEGAAKKSPKFNTRFKMLWDKHYLYLYAELEDPHIWATITKRDEVVYHDNDFEIFIDPDGDTYQYFEIELNAFQTVFDLFMPKPYRNGGLALIPWNADGMKVSVDIDGTINNPSDTDKKWSVEVAIPFSAISLGNHVQVPGEGTFWRVNFSRVQWSTEIVGNAYRKKTDPETLKPLSEHNWVWSPQGVINMHLPERWGYVMFSDRLAGEIATSFSIPGDDRLKSHLWLIYYNQAKYFREKGKFAMDMEGLELPSDLLIEGDHYQVKIESTSLQYLAVLQGASNEAWAIDQDGRIRKIVVQ